MRVVFEWHVDTWRLSLNSIMGLSDYRRLIEYNEKIFYPTPEGWELWGDFLYQYIKSEKDNEEK